MMGEGTVQGSGYEFLKGRIREIFVVMKQFCILIAVMVS